jgi:hypothetical protein
MDHDSQTKAIPKIILPQLQRCVQRIVLNVRKQVTKQHLDGFNLKDSFGSLHVRTKQFILLMHKHNDPEDAYHFRLFEFGVLGSQVRPERDIVHITFSTVCQRVDDSQRIPRNRCWLRISIEWQRHR